MKETRKRRYAIPLYIVLLVPFVVYGHLGGHRAFGFRMVFGAWAGI